MVIVTMSNAHLSNQDTDPPRDVLKELCDLLRENGAFSVLRLAFTSGCFQLCGCAGVRTDGQHLLPFQAKRC